MQCYPASKHSFEKEKNEMHYIIFRDAYPSEFLTAENLSFPFKTIRVFIEVDEIILQIKGNAAVSLGQTSWRTGKQPFPSNHMFGFQLTVWLNCGCWGKHPTVPMEARCSWAR